MKTQMHRILSGLLLMAAPMLLHAQTMENYTFNTNRLLPDGNASGLSDVRTINSAISGIASVTVGLKITGEFNGDLYGYLVHSSGFVVLLNRPGKTASNAAGYGDSGFNITFQNGAANGDVHVYQNVTTPTAGSPLTGTWQPDGRNVDPATVTDTSARTTSLTNLNGLNASGTWTLFLADLQSGGSNELTQWSMTIVGTASPTVTWTNPADIGYGTALGTTQLNATATFNATNVAGAFSYSPPLGTILNAGSGQTISVVFTPTDLVDFVPVTNSVTINVNQAGLTVTALPQSKTYGQTLSFGAGSAMFSSLGLTNGDTIGSVTLSVNNNGGVSNAPVSGTYAITPSAATGGTFAPANYSISYNSAALTINPATVTVASGLQANNKTYDGTTNASISSNSVSLSGVLTVDAANVTLSTNGYVAGFASRNVGGGIGVSLSGLTLAGSAANNYSLTEPVYSASIMAKALTVSGITAGGTIYDGTTIAKLGGAAAFASAEAPGSGNVTDGKPYSVDSVTPGGSAAGTLGAKDVGAEPVTISGVTVTGSGNGNYTVTQQTGLIQNVTAKALTMSGLTVPASKVYDETTTASVSGTPALQSVESPGNGSTGDGKPYSGDSVSITGTATGNYNSANVATASTVSFGGLSLGGAQNGDYSLTIQSAAAATITKAGVTGALVSSANPALPGVGVTFTLTLTPVPSGTGLPSGSVNFRIDGTVGGTGILTGGATAFASNSLPHGSNTVVAEYAGDGNFNGVTNALVPAEVINTPPVAGNFTIQRLAYEGAKVSLAAVLTNCSDADADTLTVTVGATSTGGAALSIVGNWLFYTPVPGFTNGDSFSYTVSDGFGGSATGTITVAIEVDTSPSQNLSITSLGNGSYFIFGYGIPGYTYTLQYSQTLNPANWQDVPGAALTADSTGEFQWTDTPADGMGFYRTVYPSQ